MKLSIVMSKRFRQDLKRAKKRGFDLMQLETVIDKIANRELLELKYHDHNLSGDLSGFRECHISPDWLLVYRVEEKDLISTLGCKYPALINNNCCYNIQCFHWNYHDLLYNLY